MPMTNRRVFMMQVVAATGATLATGVSQAKTRIDENNAEAASVGYKIDATKVDTKRFPKYKVGEKCNNCMAWLSKPTDAWGECSLFDNKLVAAPGWCSSYIKA